MFPAVEVWNPNYWTTREVPICLASNQGQPYRKLSRNGGCSVLWDNPEGWGDEEGGREGFMMGRYMYSSVQFSLVAQSCPTLCDLMNHSTPGLPVHHQLPESTQTHVH